MSVTPVHLPGEYVRLVKLYDTLAAEANEDEFVGSKTKLYESTGLSMKYYPVLFELLTNMGSIDQTHKGNSREPTRIRIGEAPTLEGYNAVVSSVTLTTRVSLDTLRRKVASLEERIPPIDLNRTLISLDARLRALEERDSQGG